MAIEIADELFDIADELEQKHLYRFAEKLRASGMSMSNNIAEGSGKEGPCSKTILKSPFEIY